MKIGGGLYPKWNYGMNVLHESEREKKTTETLAGNPLRVWSVVLLSYSRKFYLKVPFLIIFLSLRKRYYTTTSTYKRLSNPGNFIAVDSGGLQIHLRFWWISQCDFEYTPYVKCKFIFIIHAVTFSLSWHVRHTLEWYEVEMRVTNKTTSFRRLKDMTWHNKICF